MNNVMNSVLLHCKSKFTQHVHEFHHDRIYQNFPCNKQRHEHQRVHGICNINLCRSFSKFMNIYLLLQFGGNVKMQDS